MPGPGRIDGWFLRLAVEATEPQEPGKHRPGGEDPDDPRGEPEDVWGASGASGFTQRWGVDQLQPRGKAYAR